jgi:membrane protein
MRAGFAEVVDFWRFLLQRFSRDHGFTSAAALTYTTLFAVVPVMTVAFAMLSAIPAFQGMDDRIQAFVFSNFVPSTGSAVQEYLRGFVGQARQLTWIGVGLLLVTALMMLLTVERVFNDIWRVRQPRRGVIRFLIYWAILSLGPLLMGVGFATSTYIASLSLLSGPHSLLGAQAVLRVMPLLLSVLAFTLLYAAVPNTRVPLRHAAIGGCFTAVLFEATKKLFSLYVVYFPSYQLIYGAFATVPLFLLWIYLCWVMVLLGAELVCHLTSVRGWRYRRLPRLLVMFGVLEVLHRRQVAGTALRHEDMGAERWPLPEDEWSEVMEFLERRKLVCRLSNGAWVLCRDLAHYPVAELIAHSPWPVPDMHELHGSLEAPWLAPLSQAIQRLQAQRDALFQASLASWLEGAGNSVNPAAAGDG